MTNRQRFLFADIMFTAATLICFVINMGFSIYLYAQVVYYFYRNQMQKKAKLELAQLMASGAASVATEVAQNPDMRQAVADAARG